jgi:hypothetical protein
MIDPSSLLKDADPLRERAEEQELSTADAQAIRRAMLITAAAMPSVIDRRPIWRRPLPLAAAAALVASVSGIVGHRLVTRPEVQPPAADLIASSPGADSDRRQLQFATPGGTRIIWVFDDNLRLQEPIP